MMREVDENWRATDNSSNFISDARSLTDDAFRTLNVLLAISGAALGFGKLEQNPGILVAASLMCVIFAHLFLFLRSRLDVDCIRYEAAFKGSPSNHPVHILTDQYDDASGIAGIMTVILSLASVTFLCIGMIDQFIIAAFFPSVADIIIVSTFLAAVFAILGIWAWLFIRWDKTLQDLVK